MLDWKILAITAPIFFVGYQALSKLLPKTISVFLVNAYASLIGLLFMLALHFLLSPSKTIALNTKTLPIAAGMGILIALGNFGIIKAYNLGAPQSLFTIIFYVALIIYGVLFGIMIWHERLSFPQVIGALLSIAGLLLIVYYRK
jgi:drug/metabolite transporter (DMT)-like permease